MITFRTLGTAELVGPAGRTIQSVLARPKLLGLLAYLAVATPRGFHRRDSLLSLLWEDLDEDRARRALRQSLYHLRRALGEEAIVSRGDEEVGLEASAVWCDAPAFEEALDRGALRDAVELYRGNLLDGFNVSGAGTFERWLDSRRQELRLAASAAAWQLAEQAENEGDGPAAGDWARRAVGLDPFDETLVRNTIQLLDRTGNRSGAVREFDAFAQRLEEELALEPSPETRALADAVRRRSTAAPGVAGTTERTDDEPPTAGRPPASSISHAKRKRQLLPRLLMAVFALVLIVASLVVWRGGRSGRNPAIRSLDATNPRSIAVLPFDNLSGEAETEPFVDGIHEDILVHLYKIAGLRPISRTSVMEYRDTKKNLREIAEELGVSAVLEGGVQRSGDRVRITVQLIDADTDEHIWAEEYERDLTTENVFSIQAEISTQIAAALRARLSEEEAERIAYQPTHSLEAYDAYLTAREYQRRWRVNEENRRIVVQQYERAIELEPSFALAYADLSIFQSTVCYIYGCPDEVMLGTKDLADSALELEPNLAAARVALGNYYYYGLSEHLRAEQEYLRAIGLEPNNGDAHGRLAAVRARMGRFAEAVVSAETAVALGPRDSDAHDLLGHVYAWQRDYEAAIRSYDRSIALSPDVFFPRSWKAWALLNLEDGVERAEEEWTRGIEALDAQMLPLSILYYGRAFLRALGPRIPIVPSPSDVPIAETSFMLSRATVEEAAGHADAARAWYDSTRAYLESHRSDFAPEYVGSALGVVYARLGRVPEAIREAAKATELLPVSKDAVEAPWLIAALAEVYAIVGDQDAALDQLEILLSLPCPVSPPLLEIDPVWTPLRDLPRYEALIQRFR